MAANQADVDRVVVDYMRDALTAPGVLTWIEQEALRRAAELVRATEQIDQYRGREQRVQREIERLTDAIARMDLSPALAERLRKAEAERDVLERARTRPPVASLPFRHSRSGAHSW